MLSLSKHERAIHLPPRAGLRANGREAEVVQLIQAQALT
jgi:hypothetical protein